MVLITNYFNNSERQAEILECLQHNMDNKFIDHIVLFCMAGTEVQAIKSKKITCIFYDAEPTYSDYFRFGNKINSIKILANADIYFNHTLIYAYTLNHYSVYALTRWNIKGSNIQFYDNDHSQDAWLWSHKITGVNARFGLGIPGCDNAIACRIKRAGYHITNPSLSIQSIHLHKNNQRNYRKSELKNENFINLIPETL